MYTSDEKIQLAQDQQYQPADGKDVHVNTKDLDQSGTPGNGDSSPASSSHSSSTVEKWWLFEFFAWFLGAIGLIAIVIILRTTEGNPTPNWYIKSKYSSVKLTVTINSVISLFSTLVKSTLLIPVIAGMSQLKWVWFRQGHHLSDYQRFDSAAKGPLGSLILIWKFRGASLACLGAFLVIASLGLDFAFQQLVTYPLRSVVVSNGTVPRSNSYSGWRPGPITGIKLAELPMVGAAYTGLYAQNNSFLVTPDCPTGNCTWTQEYTTLGVCSKCYDVTDQIQRQCSTYDYKDTMTDDNNITTTSIVGAPVPYCNYTMPGTANAPGQQIAGNSQYDYPILLQVNNTVASNQTYFGNGLHAHIATVGIMRAEWNYTLDTIGDGDNATVRSFWEPINVNATECGLDICVKKYRGSMVLNNFKEELLDTFINATDFNFTDAESSVASLYIQPPSSWTNHTEESENTFVIDPFTITALQFLFWSAGDSPAFFQGAFADSGTGQTTSENDIVSYIRYLNDTGVDNMMTSLAASMTKRMREAPESDSTFGLGISEKGQAMKDLPHVNVRWAWISFPIILLALALIFLIASMIENARNGAILWKTNALAPFHHPLTKEGRERLQNASSPAQVEQIAKELSVKWQKTEAGYRMVDAAR
ncbi:hypothetical protein BLS_008101 [Venturia inaequalis]|uniref:Uncharacterized protein n=1 Tax=Venturia inaequalis TaxID=5025 RepID=A0A8H3V2G0_VENIN|nr:hypothetical protein BLS_008101 [Venturia inaequalis]KAE9982404.1 hypothetical protein EG328_010938 [Venturia inaequalis]KAE9989962.1 hypothetical protein EG327_002058 [Venturia inaequalis]RDI85626.1 hypothetical protein Vi05172_g4495 [Venturia inaequalis]